MWTTLTDTLLGLVFPLDCGLCGELLPSRQNGGICGRCENAVVLIPGPHCPGCGRTALFENARCGRCENEKFHFDRAFACVFYKDGMKTLLHDFKFGRKRFLAPFFSRLMMRFALEHLRSEKWALVVPVPMDKKKEFERGFNPSEALSASVAKKTGRPHLAGALACRPAETPQAALTKTERRSNVRGRFFVRKPEAVVSKNILLVDDILTTGQTASACALALKIAGSGTVTVLAFARGA